MTVITKEAAERCEKILLKSKAYNVENSCLPSETLIIDRLLGESNNMEVVYAELYERLNDQQLSCFLSLLLSSAAFWNPEKTALYRNERKELEETNREISKVSRLLSRLLDKRDCLHNQSGFSSETHYHIIDVIKKSSSDNYLYESCVNKPLDQIRSNYDLKYWPSIKDVIAELAEDAQNAEVYASDILTEASTNSNRASKVDFLRALFSAINENSERNYGLLPSNFELSDRSYAEIMNCALNLDSKDLVDAAYVKRARQREREHFKNHA